MLSRSQTASPHVRGAEGDAAVQGSARPRLIAKAVAIHRLTRSRSRHFRIGLLADNAMALLLSLFIAEQQGTQVSERALALANDLSSEEASAIFETMIHAGLAVISGIETGRRTVGLTPLGSARTHSFIDDHPDV